MDIPAIESNNKQHLKMHIKGKTMPIIKKLEHLELNYNPHLIETLHEEHNNLLNHMHFIQKTVEEKELRLLPIALELFRGEMLEHVSKEILQLYVYLRNALKNRPEHYELVKRLRKEMDSILKTILEFLDEYSNIEIESLITNKEIQTDFLEGINELVTLFSRRVDVEERILFPLYQQIK